MKTIEKITVEAH